MRTLTQLDLTGIQPFLFGARRLRANLGASFLVHHALAVEGWLGAAARIEGATVLWSGGGNAVVDARDEAAARRLSTRLSFHLVREAPGLGLACAHVPWDGPETYPVVAPGVRRALEAAKAAASGAARFDGGGVCEPCRDTADPAVGLDEEGSPVGASIDARERARDRATARLRALYTLPDGLDWTDDIDELGRTTGEESALGVVHVDGNQMGAHFEGAEREGLAAVQKLSADVDDAGRGMLVAGLTWVAKRIADGTLGVPLVHKDEVHKYFPVRPVVYGGDDLTLLCDGRIALDLAATLLADWHARTGWHACAGIALVRPHYPFYRAVVRAHQLCNEAKRTRKTQMSEDASLIHWSLHRSGSAAPVSVLHTARPYVVAGPDVPGKPWRSWRWLRQDCVSRLQAQVDHHSQIKALAEPLASGPDAARRALLRLADRHGLHLPSPPHHQLGVTGFEGDETPYLDALELLDLVPRGAP